VAAAPAQPVKKEKRKKDPNAPKKPMSAFFCFQMARRQGLKNEAPGLNHKDIIKVSSRRSSLPPAHPLAHAYGRAGGKERPPLLYKEWDN
jgi:hypothetical protein